jgi:hypothetical protein
MKPVLILPLFLLYFVLCTGIISYIPIAWIDEAMFADASRNLALEGRYASKLWEQPQTDEFLLGHLPLWQLILSLWYKVFPTSLFWTRLPGVILYAGFSILAWLYFSKQLKPAPALILTFLCVGDKAIFEAARSVRMDMLGAFILMLLATGYTRKWNVVLMAFFCGLLALVHPNFWFASILIGISLLQNSKIKWQLWLAAAFPILLYLLWIFPWRQLIFPQLLANGGDHIRTDGNLLQILQQYFYLRFFKWYEVQQALPILYVISLVTAPFLYFRQKLFRPWILLMWVQTVFLISLTGDYPRYNLPVVISVWLLAPAMIRQIPEQLTLQKAQNLLIILLTGLALYPLLSRAALAWYQREERDPDKVISWLKQTLPDQNETLLMDEAIGYYLQRPGTDFAFLHSLDKFDLGRYTSGIYRLTYVALPEQRWKMVESYPETSASLPEWIPLRQTYRGLKLYRFTGSDTTLVSER